jgi:hypothetical protein
MSNPIAPSTAPSIAPDLNKPKTGDISGPQQTEAEKKIAADKAAVAGTKA